MPLLSGRWQPTNQRNMGSVNATRPSNRHRPWQRLLFGLLCLLLLITPVLTAEVRETLQRTVAGLQGLGPLGVIAYGFVYVATVLLLVPATFLTLGAGATFGLAVGFPLVWFSATAGATGAFVLGRSLSRPWIEERLSANPRLAALDRAVGRSGWKIVLLSRMCPFFPFTLLNYAYGGTQISLPRYILATAAGLIPGVFFYVWIGATLGDISGLRARDAVHGPWQWAFYAVGLGIAAGVTGYVGRLAQRALNQEVEPTPSPPPPQASVS